MKIKHFFLLICCFPILASQCKKERNNIDESLCSNAKVIKVTCGGIIIQLLKRTDIGSVWRDPTLSNGASYPNCVLIGKLADDQMDQGQVLSIKFEVVEFLGEGNYCEIGGLPNTKISIMEYYECK